MPRSKVRKPLRQKRSEVCDTGRAIVRQRINAVDWIQYRRYTTIENTSSM
jgi:hypothetical protein